MFHVIVAATWPGNAAVNRPVIPLPSIYQCLTEWKAAEGKQTARCLLLLRLLVCWGYVSVCMWVFTWYLFICVDNNQTPPLLVAVFQHDSPASEEGQQGEGAPSRCRVSVTAVQLLHRSSSREDLARWVNHPPTSLVFMYSIWAAGDGLGTAESPLWPKGFAWLASIHHAEGFLSRILVQGQCSASDPAWPLTICGCRMGSSQWGFNEMPHFQNSYTYCAHGYVVTHVLRQGMHNMLLLFFSADIDNCWYLPASSSRQRKDDQYFHIFVF